MKYLVYYDSYYGNENILYEFETRAEADAFLYESRNEIEDYRLFQVTQEFDAKVASAEHGKKINALREEVLKRLTLEEKLAFGV